MSKETSVEVSRSLRNLMYAARHARERWDGRVPTQEQVADAIGKTSVWYRNIESGYVNSASLDVITSICLALCIDPEALEVLGYHSVASAVQARQMLEGKVTLDLTREPELTDGERQALAILIEKMRVRSVPAARRRRLTGHEEGELRITA